MAAQCLHSDGVGLGGRPSISPMPGGLAETRYRGDMGEGEIARRCGRDLPSLGGFAETPAAAASLPERAQSGARPQDRPQGRSDDEPPWRGLGLGLARVRVRVRVRVKG